jgi:hypothetical protein
MNQSFGDRLRLLADEADKRGYVGGAIIDFGGFQFTLGANHEFALEDPLDTARKLAFLVEGEICKTSMLNGRRIGPFEGKIQ